VGPPAQSSEKAVPPTGFYTVRPRKNYSCGLSRGCPDVSNAVLGFPTLTNFGTVSQPASRTQLAHIMPASIWGMLYTRDKMYRSCLEARDGHGVQVHVA